jgi:hypothetical protein
MYCGDTLIDKGMTKLDVISKCGQPDLREVTSLVFQVREVWHYNCGEGRLNRSLVFEGETLVSVQESKVTAAARRSANKTELIARKHEAAIRFIPGRDRAQC